MMNGGSASSDHQGAVDWSIEDKLDLTNFLNEFQADVTELGAIVDAPTINPNYPIPEIMSAIDSGTNMIGGSSNMSQTGIPQQAINVSSLTPENSTTLTTQIRTIVDAPTINQNYPSHPSQPIMFTINSGSNLSGGSSNMAHMENNLIPNKCTTMPVSSGQTSAATKLISASVAQISQSTHAYQNQPLPQHVFMNKAVQQPPTHSSVNQSNSTLAEQEKQPYQQKPKDQPSHCSRSIPNSQMVIHNSQASKQNSQQSQKQTLVQIQQGTGSRQRGNNNTNSLSASVDIKTPNEFPTHDAWHEYALRKVKKLKEEYFKELLDIHQSTIESRIKETTIEEVNKYEKVRMYLESMMMFLNISSVNEFPRDHVVYDYLTGIVKYMMCHRNKNNNLHQGSKRSQVLHKSSQSVGTSSRRPTQLETRTAPQQSPLSVSSPRFDANSVLSIQPLERSKFLSSSLSNQSNHGKQNASPLSSASPVETQKLKTPIQETPNSKDPILRLVDVVKSVSSKSMVSALNDISCVQKVMDSIPEYPPSDSASLLLQYENEPQRKIRRTQNMSVYHDQVFSDEWDIDFLETTMNMKPSVGNKGFILDEIRKTNFELLETSLVVVLDTAGDYVKILGGQGGTIVKCLYTNVCFPDLCGPQKMPDFVVELIVPVDYPNSSPKIFNSGHNVLSQPWKKLYEDILTRFELSLCEIPGQISLGDMAREWDVSARSVITKFVEGKSRNSFSSRYGSWESCMMTSGDS